MTPEIARNIMTLLMRVDIKGPESPVWQQAMAALQQIAEAKVSDNPPMKLVSGE